MSLAPDRLNAIISSNNWEQEYGSEGYCRRKTFGIRGCRGGYGKDEDERLALGWIAILMTHCNCSSNAAYIAIVDARWIDAGFCGLLAGFSLSWWRRQAPKIACVVGSFGSVVISPSHQIIIYSHAIASSVASSDMLFLQGMSKDIVSRFPYF
jgi:hypothetical protein